MWDYQTTDVEVEFQQGGNWACDYNVVSLSLTLAEVNIREPAYGIAI